MKIISLKYLEENFDEVVEQARSGESFLLDTPDGQIALVPDKDVLKPVIDSGQAKDIEHMWNHDDGSWQKITTDVEYDCTFIRTMSSFISKFKKNLDALEKAVDQEIALDYKYPKIYKKVLRYYKSEGYEFSEEDPEQEYSSLLKLIAQDLESTKWLKYYYRMNLTGM